MKQIEVISEELTREGTFKMFKDFMIKKHNQKIIKTKIKKFKF